MSLFQRPTDQEGFFVPDPGDYILEIASFEEFDGKFGKSVKWNFLVFNEDNQPVLYDGQPARFDALSSPKMGPSSKARGWANAFLSPDREVVDDEDPEALLEELIGRRASGQFVKQASKDGKGFKVVLGGIFPLV